MSKVVQLKIEGDWEGEGFAVTMSSRLEGKSHKMAIAGRLPPAPELLDSLKDWQDKYRILDKYSSRLNPVKIFNDNVSLEQRKWDCDRSADRLKDPLQQWLNSSDFREIDKRLREELNRSEPIRLLICTKDWQLQKLPWHLWDCVDRYDNVEVALSPLNYERSPKSGCRTRKQKVRILAILGDSKGINIAKDRQLLENLPDAEIEFLVEPQRREINDQLWEQPWDIIFFAGHSKSHGETGKIDINPTESLTIKELSYGLRKAVEGGLQLAIFNSCDGLGLARELDSVHIPQVIVMREIVPDKVAQAFLKYFLTNFAKGGNLYKAVGDARKQLQGLEDKYPCASWLPTIWQNPAEVPFPWADLLQKPEESLAKGNNSQRKVWHQIGWVALGLMGVGLAYARPNLATWVNNLGWENYLANAWPEAIESWNSARKIDPHNPVPLYNQGSHCEDVRDFDCAKEKYKMSAQLGFAAAYSNLARLYILVYKDYSAAVDLLRQSRKFVYKEPERTQGFLNYAFHKNMGWARLEQGRYQEASEHLQTAIDLDGDRAPAYCLLAQVQQRQGNSEGAKDNWKTCLQYGIPENPEEDIWMNMARSILKSVEISHKF